MVCCTQQAHPPETWTVRSALECRLQALVYRFGSVRYHYNRFGMVSDSKALLFCGLTSVIKVKKKRVEVTPKRFVVCKLDGVMCKS